MNGQTVNEIISVTDTFETVTRIGLERADKEIKETASLAVVKARELVIKTSDDMARADNLLLAVRTVRKQIAGLFDSIINAAHKAHKEALNRKASVDAPLERAETDIRRAMGVFERDRLQKEKEAEAARLKALDDAKKKTDDDLLRAAELESKGETAAAAEIVDKVIAEAEKPVVPAVPPPPPRPYMPGTSFREDWKFEITDPAALPREYLMADESKIGKVVRALKRETKIPGVRVYSETQAQKRIPSAS